MKWWQYLLRSIIPTVEMAGQMYVDQDSNDTGKDDLIGRTLLYIVALVKAVLSGDTNAIQKQLDKTSVDL